MLAALIENGICTNMIVADPAEVQDGRLWVDGTGGAIGDRWEAGAWIKPPPSPTPVPTTVTARQARLALSRAGRLAETEAALAAMTGQEGEEARIEWEYAAVLERAHPMIDALGTSLGLTSEQMDNLFRQAATL